MGCPRKILSHIHFAFSDSCKRVTCGEGKTCMEDQNGLPHCVLCSKQCFNSIVGSKPVCGVNGITYASTCDLKADICNKGRSINIAYEGRCQGKHCWSDCYYRPRSFVERYCPLMIVRYHCLEPLDILQYKLENIKNIGLYNIC